MQKVCQKGQKIALREKNDGEIGRWGDREKKESENVMLDGVNRIVYLENMQFEEVR